MEKTFTPLKILVFFLLLTFPALASYWINPALETYEYPQKPSELSHRWYESPMGIFALKISNCDTDTEPPSVITQNITVQLDNNGAASITTTDIDNGSNDACGIESMSVSPSSFTCSEVGANTVTLTVTDNNGNTNTATATVTVEDNQAPVALAQNITVQLDNNGAASITAIDIDNGSNDACGIDSMSVSPSNFTCSEVGANTVTLTVTDNNGNTNTATATVTVEDNQAPVALAQNITVQLDNNGAASITAIDIDNGSNDACGIDSMSVSPSNFTCSEVGANTVTLTVTDNNGNVSTANAIVTIEDTIYPTASDPAPVNVQCSTDIPAADISVVTNESDNCNSGLFVSFISDISDNNSNPQVIFRTYRITDPSGNSIDVTQTITVDDTENPTASNPAGIDVQCSADVPDPDISVVIDEADNCTPNPTVTFVSDSSNGQSNPEIITRKYRVTDEAGNSIDVTQTITVNDTTDPTASNPAGINVQCSADIPNPDISVVIDEADNCTPNPTVTFVSDSSNGQSNPEIITRKYRVTDEAGNSIDVTQTITVNDTTDPTASNPAGINVQCSADIPNPDISVVTDEADNCTPNPTVTFVSDVSDGNFNPEIVTRTFNIVDEAGNTTEVTQEIYVQDTQIPDIPILPDITSECPITVDPPTSTDNCDGTVTGTTGLNDLTFSESGSVYWIFTDASGNATEPVEQKVIIDNTIAPVPDVGSLPTKTIDGCQISSLLELDIPTATDACDGTIYGTLSEDFEFPFSFSGTETIEWEFIDSVGNMSTQIQEIKLNPLPVAGGLLRGTYLSTQYDNQIDISSCGDAISVELNLTGETGNVVHWEKYAVNEGIWEIIPNSANITSYTAEFAEGALESTYFRVLVQTGTCKETSNSFYIRALPVGAAPTVSNEDPDNIYCLGESVNLLAISNYLGTEDAIPDSTGDFNEGQLNTQDPNSWLVDGDPGGFSAGGNAKQARNWSGTNDHKFGDITYDGGDGKFAIAQGNFNDGKYKGANPTTLESPIMDLSDAETASLDFDQAYYFANGDIAKIEISLDGGASYTTLKIIHAAGGGIKQWFTAGTAESTTGSNATNYNFSTDNTSISLNDYLGESNVRIRWSFVGTSDKSVWALDNIFVNKKTKVDTELEWTIGIGDPDEEPIAIGQTQLPISFIPDTPGVYEYGGTALINECRTYSEDGTGLTPIKVSYSYAGEDIIYTSAECGRNTVQLNAYDNTITANENIVKGAFTAPASGCRTCDAPGTGDIGEWSWTGNASSCQDVSFSDVHDPDATFTAGPGTYTLTWTVNGCSNDITVTITNCDQVDFDGTNDHIDFGDSYDLTGAFSLEVWVKPEAKDGTRTIISKRDANFTGTAKGYDLIIKDGTVSFNWDQSGSISSSPYEIDTNRWYHLALTHSASGEYKLYVDGILMKSTAGGAPGNNTYKALLGAMDRNGSAGPTHFFNGWMEELRIWKVALTPGQLRLMMNQRIKNVAGNKVQGEVLPLPVPNLDWSNLAGYYRMDEVGCGNLYPFNDGVNYIGHYGQLKNINTDQNTTAPLPYTTSQNGQWFNNSGTWTHADVWDPPFSPGINNTKIEWNIAEIAHDVQSNNKDIKLLGLIVETAGTLDIQGTVQTRTTAGSGNGLTVTHYLDLSGYIDLNGESQLVQPEGSQLVGSGYLDRDQQGTASSYNYNYWSSPVNTGNTTEFTIGGVLRDGTDSIPGTINFKYNFRHADGPLSSPIKISSYWLNKFFGEAGKYSNWKQIGVDTQLKPGEGFTMKGPSGQKAILDLQNYTFRGMPNNGTIKLNIGTDQNYLIGNPYPSAIDANKFIKDNLKDVTGGTNSQNVFNGSIYFWSHFSGQTHYLQEYVGGYAVYNLSGGIKATANDERINATGDEGGERPRQYIPVGQGFFINTVLDPDLSLSSNTTVSGGDIIFRNSQRIFQSEADNTKSVFHSAERKELNMASNYVSNRPETEPQRMQLWLKFKSPGGYHRQILVTKDPATTSQFDLGYDALLIEDNKEDMYWLMGDGKVELVIQGVPDFNRERILPLGIKIATKGEFRIAIDEMQDVPDELPIFIKDNQTETYHDLRASDFVIKSKKGLYHDRYSIVFSDGKDPDGGTDGPGEGDGNDGGDGKGDGEEPINPEQPQPTPPGLELAYSLKEKQIVIGNTNLLPVKKVVLYNSLGQEIQTYRNIQVKTIIELPVELPSAGMYFVRVYTEDSTQILKFLVD
ncbi:LamG-like jellyroll fold domain-containing protein [Salinimicrobium sp. CAU 1759]